MAFHGTHSGWCQKGIRERMSAYWGTKDHLSKRDANFALPEVVIEQPWYRRPVAMLMALLLSLAGFSSFPQFASEAHAADADSFLSLTKSGPSSAAPGDTLTYRVTATNPADSGKKAFNTSFVDSLPAGVEFVSGSTQVDYPYSFGDPAAFPVTAMQGDPLTPVATGEQVLVWSNELDLNPGQTLTFEYQVKVTAEAQGKLTNTAQAFANSDPRTIPALPTTGTVESADPAGILSGYNQTSGPSSVDTTVSKVTLLKDKSNPLDTGSIDWLRGVHENQRAVNLTLQNADSTGITRTVVDYLPAAFEFLSGTDNSTSAASPAGSPEWTAETDASTQSAPTQATASSVTGTGVTGSLQTIETVTLADGDVPGVAAGVYTKSTWEVTVPAGSTATITYHAGIPLQANTAWGADAPSATSLDQASNLDNNTGQSTRDLVGQTFTNVAQTVVDGQPEITDSRDYTIQDMAVGKSAVDANGAPLGADEQQQRIGQKPAYNLTPGKVSYFNLSVDLSEYVGASPVTITDVLPDGLQPVPTGGDDSQTVTHAVDAAVAAHPNVDRYSGDPIVLASTPSGATYKNVEFDATTNGYQVSIEFPGTGASADANTLTRSGSVTVRIPVYAQTNYTSNPDSKVVSYDLFTNTVNVDATTNAGVAQEVAGDRDLSGADSVDLRVITPSLKKGVLARQDVAAFTSEDWEHSWQAGAEAGDDGGSDVNRFKGHAEGAYGYGVSHKKSDGTTIPETDLQYQRGDIIWFHLHTQLPTTTDRYLRNTTLIDYLPEGVELVAWNYSHHDATGGNATWKFTQDGQTLTWSGRQNYQQLSTTSYEFAINVAVRVTAAAPAAGSSAQVIDNLAKLSIENTPGQIVTFRDTTTATIQPDPQVALQKDIVGISDGDSGRTDQTWTDGSTVKSGQTVTYKITTTNNSGYAINDPEIWDVLPTEFDATTAKLYKDAALSQEVTGALDQSSKTLKWTSEGALASGASVAYYVTQKVPENPEVNKLFTNTAGVRHFTTTLDETTTAPKTWDWYPSENIDDDINKPDAAIKPNAPAAKDTASVRAVNVVLNKQVTSGLGQTNNNWSRTGQSDLAKGVYGDSAQAVVGERVDYRITLDIPAHATITDAKLNDALARGSDPQVVLNTASNPAVSWVNASGPLTSGVPSVTFSEKTANGFKSTIANWTNTSDQTVTLTVGFSGVVSADPVKSTSPDFADAAALTRDRNAASFVSQANSTSLNDTADVDIVQPKISATKAAAHDGAQLSDTSRVEADDVIDYQVTGTADAGRPALKTPVLKDNLPEGLLWQGLGAVKLNGAAVDGAVVSATLTVDGTVTALAVGDSIPANTVLTVSIGDAALNAAGIQPVKSFVVNYQAKLPNPIGAATVFTNTATVQGDSLSAQEATDQNGGQVNKTYAKQASKDITAVGFTTVKTREDSALTYGQQQTYTIDSLLPANTTGYNVTVSDTLPQGITFAGTTSVQVSDDGAQWSDVAVTTSQDAQKIRWVLTGDAENRVTTTGHDRQIRVIFQANVTGLGADGTTYFEPGATIANTASIGWNDSNKPTAETFDHTSASEPANFTVIGPKLTPTKSVVKVNNADPVFDGAKAKVNPADVVTYQVVLTNWTGENASTAYDIEATDQLPKNFAPSSVTNVTVAGTDGVQQAVANFSAADGLLTITAGAVPAGGKITVAYDAKLIDSAQLNPASDTWAADNTNTVTVDSYTSQPKNGGEYPEGTRTYTGTATAEIVPVFPKVTVSKTPEIGIATRGSAYQWSISATNSGAGIAKNVKLVDKLPDNWGFAATASVTKISGTNSTSLLASTSGPAASASGTVSWSDAGQDGWTLQPGETITVVYTATPNDGTAPDTTKAATGEHTNTVGAELTDASGAKTNGDASSNTGTITEQGDSSYAGSDDTAKAYINEADLSVTKTGLAKKSNSPANPIIAGSGQQAAWDIVVTNNGPDQAAGPFAITDVTELPAGVQITSISEDSQKAGWNISSQPTRNDKGKWEATYTYGGPSTIVAKGADLPKLTILVTADANAAVDPIGGAVGTDTAKVEGNTLDDDPSNDSSTDTVDFVVQADLQLKKQVTTAAADIASGKPLGWALTVTNNGVSDSVGTSEKPITVKDIVPTGVKDVVVGALPTGWSIAAGSKGTTANKAQAGDTITLQFVGTLAATASAQVSLGGTILPTFLSGDIKNTAVVEPGATTEPSDPGTSNNSDSTTTAITDTNNGTTLAIDKHRVVKGSDGQWVPPTDSQTITPGQDVSYLITVGNQGPADAKNVTSRDVLPEGLTYKSIENAAGTWSYVSADGQTVNVKLTSGDPAGQLAAGASAAYVITASTSPSITSDVENWAYAKGDNTNEPKDSDNGGPVRSVDLGIVKSVTDEKAVPTAGKDLGYTLTITNHGSSDTSGPITVTDALPSQLAYVANSGRVVLPGQSAQGLEPSTSSNDGKTTLTWQIGDESLHLAVGQTITVTLNTHVAQDAAAGKLVNVATVDGPDSDPNPSNNTSQKETPITTSTDVLIDKTVAAGPWIAGTDVKYNVKLTVTGPSIARNVTLSDVLPAGLTPVSIGADGDGWTWNQTTATGSRDTLAPGSYIIPVTAHIEQGVVTGTDLVNSATTTWTDTDPNTPNTKSDDETITVATDGDLQLTKTAVDENGQEVSSATAGSVLRYQFDVTNNGPSQAVAPIRIADTLPAGVTFGSIVSGDGWSVAAGSTATAPKFEYAGALATGANAPALVIEVSIAQDAYLTTGETHALTNTATATSDTPDSRPDNNTDTSTVTVSEQADLDVTKTHDASLVHIGESLPFTITTTNYGPSTARGVVIAETLPKGLTYVGLQPDQGAEPSEAAWQQVGDPTVNTDGTTTVTFALLADEGDLASGASAPVLKLDTTVTVEAYASIVNGVDVSSDTPEPTIEPGQDDPHPNHVDDPVTVPALSTLVVDKQHQGDLKVGENGTYVITLTNQGPTEDPGVITVTDELPKGLIYKSADQQDVTAAGQTVTWTPPVPLAVGETRTLTLTVYVSEAASEHIVNTVSVTSDTEQTPDAVLTDSDEANVQPADALSPLAKTGLDFSILLAAFVLLIGGAALVMCRSKKQSHGSRAR